MNIQHSSRSDLWHTPLGILDKVHAVLGTIELDPASDSVANARVKAEHIITEQQDGLNTTWPSDKTVFINPPGGRLGNKSKTSLFWGKLMDYKATGNLKHAIFLAFSAEALQNTQNKSYPAIGNFTLCVPAKRIRFDLPNGESGKAPSHSNVIVYVPGSVDKTNLFLETFEDLGTILNKRVG